MVGEPVRDYVRRTCTEQGKPEFVRDDAVIDRVVAIVRPAIQGRLNNGDGPVREHRPVEDSGRLTTAKAG